MAGAPQGGGAGSAATLFMASLAVIAYAGARLASEPQAPGSTKSTPWWRPSR
jgi:hypothetical protein